MITRLSHATIYVASHEEGLAFYVEKLGFEVRMDATMDGFRWLTVGPKGQPDLQIALMELKPNPMMPEETVSQLKQLMEKGALGTGVFATDDCQATYKELSEKGVQFMQPPAERPYGIEAIVKDPFGNWFSLTQPKG